MATFEVYQSGRKNEFRLRLKADKRQIIISSEGYTSGAACLNGIDSVTKDAAKAAINDVKKETSFNLIR